MAIIIRTISFLWKIGCAWTGVVVLLGLIGVSYPQALLLPSFLALLVFLDVGTWMGVWQIAGNFIPCIVYGAKLPSDSNYDCKADYILPFEGKWTVFNGGMGKELSHSWDIVPQRHAYDFIVMDNEGKSFAGDNKSLQSYFCYGKNVVAPADGTVVKVSNNHKDSRVTGTKVYCDTWDIRGNFIVIQHREKEFSVCAHLIPGSIPVRVGDVVKQGQLIGKCGNSGNTSEPHLHFQLQTGKSFFASAGLPISFVNVSTREKVNYALADTRTPQKEVLQARGEGRVYIGRGLEVENRG
ncbi:MAG: M23 family metallopeptidase [Firmicutes bacterium]|nr:M23 family metallopeptidase [Bacillota bacterium]